jgi:hypothetical protein
VLTISSHTAQAGDIEGQTLLKKARMLYYQSIEDGSKIDPAIELFNRVKDSNSALQGRVTTYIGSLLAIKAKYEFWPTDKAKYAWRGLRTMDDGLALKPDDIESLFIHGATCFYLPKIFGKSDDAQRDFRNVVKLLPENMHHYDPELLDAVIDFLVQNIRLTSKQKENLDRVQRTIARR